MLNDFIAPKQWAIVAWEGGIKTYYTNLASGPGGCPFGGTSHGSAVLFSDYEEARVLAAELLLTSGSYECDISEVSVEAHPVERIGLPREVSA